MSPGFLEAEGIVFIIIVGGNPHATTISKFYTLRAVPPAQHFDTPKNSKIGPKWVPKWVQNGSWEELGR